jgi:predicted phage terminase large subunit-like protein
MSTINPAQLPLLEALLDQIGPLRLLHCPLTPTPRQEAFLRLTCREALFGGAAGGGKSIALLMDAGQYAEVPGYHALLLRPTLGELEQPGGLLDLAHQWYSLSKATWSGDLRAWRFPGPGRSGAGGSSIRFGYFDGQRDVNRYSGSSYSYLGFDELQVDELSYHRMQRVLRQPSHEAGLLRSADGLALADVPVRCRATSNPGGAHHHWIRAYFVDQLTRPKGVLYLPARWSDNKYLDFESYARGLAHLPLADRERLMNGDWEIPDEGNIFQRSWFEIIDYPQVPEETRVVRYWDLAGSEPTSTNPDPDYTVGLRLEYDDTTGLYYVTGLRRERRNAGDIEELMLATAAEDGPGVRIYVEQEPGSQGGYLENHLKYELLADYNVTMHSPRGSKEARALPVAAAAARGRIKLVALSNAREFLDEISQFPYGRHDDCVDALTGAVHAIGRTRQRTYGSGVARGSFTEDDGLGRIWSHPDWFR